MIVAGVDVGGTSCKALIAKGPSDILARTSIPTGYPETTIGALCDWLHAQRSSGTDIKAVGLASFGPIDRDPASVGYGALGNTPKQGWRGVNARVQIEQRLGLPCALDTDVNGALLAEVAWGAARGLTDVAYITVGAGVGGAAIVGGRLVGEPFHGEFGHFRPFHSVGQGANFTGSCPSHGDCIEGMVSATAVNARWGSPPHELGDDHEAWPIISHTLAQLCTAITYLLVPQRIVLGGGLLQRPSLIGRIRGEFEKQTNGYGLRPEARNCASYLCLPGLGADAGAMGGILLAMNANKILEQHRA